MPDKVPKSVWLLLTSLYATQYLGLGFLLTGLVAIIREGGVSLETVGFVYLIGFAWPLKVLWAPLVDRVRFGGLGHYRGWLLLTQSGLVLALIWLSFLHPLQDLGLVLTASAVVAVLSATQDTAVNGLVCLIIPVRDRGPAKSLHNAGHLLGIILGGGFTLLIYEQWGWRTAMTVLAAGTAIALLQLLSYREPLPGTAAPRRTQISALRAPFCGAGGVVWLLLLILLPINVSMAYGLVTPLLVDAGWTMRSVGLVVNILGPGAGIFSALATGALLRRHSRRTLVIATAILQVPTAMSLLLPILGIGGDAGTAIGVMLFYFFYQPSQTVAMTAMMDRAGTTQPAAVFSLQSSLHMLSGMGAMVAGASLAAHVGYFGTIIAATAPALLAVAFALFYRAELGHPATSYAANPMAKPA